MTHLDSDERMVLRRTLGLSFYCRTEPTRNWLGSVDAEKYADTVAALEQRGFLAKDKTHGQGGVEWFYKTTDAGRIAVLDQPWE